MNWCMVVYDDACILASPEYNNSKQVFNRQIPIVVVMMMMSMSVSVMMSVSVSMTYGDNR